MKILVTNDDSINAPGLKVLIDCAAGFGDVVAVAPAQPQSGKSSAISVGLPLRINRLDDYNGARMYSVEGTPVDCVKLALHTIMDQKPDLVLAGINHGSNSGNCVIYSGTMGAVLEGCMAGITSVGFSLLHHSLAADFSLSQNFVTEIIDGVIKNIYPNSAALNVNIPSKIVPSGIRVCRAALGQWSEEYQEYTDPFGRPFYMLSGKFVDNEPDATDTDEYWLKKGYITVVPVTPDMTQRQSISALSPVFDK